MAKLIVNRHGYKRKAYTRKTLSGKHAMMPAAHIRPATFRIKDRGAPGRGRKVVPPLERGALGGPGFFSKPVQKQKDIVFKRARKFGEKKVVGELRSLQVFFKRTDPLKSRRALYLSKEVAGSFKGKKQVPFPSGFSRTKA